MLQISVLTNVLKIDLDRADTASGLGGEQLKSEGFLKICCYLHILGLLCSSNIQFITVYFQRHVALRSLLYLQWNFEYVYLCLDLARIPVLQNLSGYSLLPLLLEKAEDEVPRRGPRPSWVLSEFHGCNVNASTYMLRTDQWKYITYSDGVSVPPQLFGML